MSSFWMISDHKETGEPSVCGDGAGDGGSATFPAHNTSRQESRWETETAAAHTGTEPKVRVLCVCMKNVATVRYSTTLRKDYPDERSCTCKSAWMWDHHHGRPPWWETTQMKYHLDERPPRWKTTLMKDNLYERPPWWKTPWWKTTIFLDHFKKKHLSLHISMWMNSWPSLFKTTSAWLLGWARGFCVRWCSKDWNEKRWCSLSVWLSQTSTGTKRFVCICLYKL